MSSDNTSIPSTSVSATTNNFNRGDRSAMGWARDNTPLVAPVVPPADTVNAKPVSGQQVTRKKLNDGQELSTDTKASSDGDGPVAKTSVATENANRENLSPQPRSENTAMTGAELAGSSDQPFDRKGDRGVYDWGRDAPVVADQSGNSSLYALLTGGLLTAGMVGSVSSAAVSNSVAPSSVFKAVVMDGLIDGAEVYIGGTFVGQTNVGGNLVGHTNKDGVIVFTSKPPEGVIWIKGGTNIDTHLPNTLILKSNANFSQDGTLVISPVTTLVAELVAKTGLSESDAQDRVKAALGISSAIDLNNYDPLAAGNKDTPDGLLIQKIGAQLATVGSSSSFAEAAYSDFASYLVSHSSATKLDLSNLSTLQQIYSTPTDTTYQELNNVAIANVDILAAKSAADVAIRQLAQASPVISGLQVDSGKGGDSITNDPRLVITGLNAKAVVELSTDGGITWVAQDKFAPADGTYSLIAQLKYEGGFTTPSSAPFTFTLNTAQPEQPKLALADGTDTGFSSADHVTSSLILNVTGKTAGSTLQYSLDNNFVTSKVTVDGSGKVLDDGKELLDGKYDLYARQVDTLTGNASAVYKFSFELDKHALPGTMGLGANTESAINDSGANTTDGITNNNHPQLAGQTEAGATSVDVTFAGTKYHVAPSDLHADGSWTLNLPDNLRLADGIYTPKVEVTDAAGNTSSADMSAIKIDTQAPNEVIAQLATASDSGFSSDDGLTNVNRPEISGHTDAFATVSVDLGLDNPLVTQADKNGNWTVVASTALEDGDYTPVITITDLAGNVSEPIDGTPFSVMASGPAETTPTTLVDDPAIDTGISSTDGVTNSVLPTLTGTLDTGLGGDITSTIVVVRFAGHTYVTQPDDAGVWTIQIPEGRELEDGTYVPGITYLDPAGNTVQISGTPVTIDTVAPDTATADIKHDAENDSGLSHTDGITNNTSPVIEGTTDPFAHVLVDLNGTTFETDADANGNWMVQADGLDDGEYTPQVTVTDLAGNVGDPIDAGMPFIISTAAPEAPTGQLMHDDVSDTGIDTNDSVTANNRPSFEGTATANAEVTLTFVTPDNQTLKFTTLADADGIWTLTLDKNLPDGEYTPVVSITDLAGNQAETELAPVVIDTAPPSADTVTAGLTPDSDNDTGVSQTDGITNNSSAILVGTADANSLIHVDVAGTFYDTQAGEDGSWSVTFDALDDGTYTPVIYVVDAAGNESVGINGTPFRIDTSAPDSGTANLVHNAVNDTGVSEEDGLTNNSSPLFEGKAEAFSHITLDLNGSVFEADADANGNWKIQAEGLEDGDYLPLITVTDQAGNSSDPAEGEPFTLLTVAPEAPTGGLVHDDLNDTGVAIDDSITANNAPLFEGSATPDSVVTLTFNIGGGKSLSFNTTTDADGNWSLELDKPLPDGIYIPIASVTDAAGNTSITEFDALIVDTAAPTANTVTVALTSDADNDTGVSAADEVTNNNAPNISGTADPFSLIRLDVAGSSYFTDADETGRWTVGVDTLADGTYVPVVYVVDAAGNASAPITGHVFIIDTAAPSDLTAGLLHNASNDTGISATDGITNNSKPSIAGTTEAFATVSVDFGDVIYDTQADSKGSWTLVPKNNLPDGQYTPVITVTDKAGNVSDPVEGEVVTIKTSITVASGGLTHDDVNDTGVSADDGITNNNLPSLSGLADAASTVVVTLNGRSYSALSDADGVWSVDTTAVLPDGTYLPSIKIIDAAGNSTSLTGDAITIDTVAGMPGGEIGTHQVFTVDSKVNFNPIPAGLSGADALVEDLNGNLPDGLSIDANGHIVGTPSATGATWIQITANDLAGNTATQAFQLVVTNSDKGVTSSSSNYDTVSITSLDPAKSATYTGGAGPDHLNVYASSSDVILGGGGNDLFQMFKPASLDFSRLDGGSGNDQINFSGTNLVFDFAEYNHPDGTGKVIEHIESFYFLGSKSDITVTASDLFHLRSDFLDVDGVHQTVRFMAGSTNGGTVAMDGLIQVGSIDAWGSSGAKSTGASNDKYTKFTGTYTDSSGDHLVELLLQHGLHAA